MKQLGLPYLDLKTTARTTARCDALRRANWWEPFTWEHSGMGMSYVYHDDYSRLYKLKGEKLMSAKFYGLKHEKTFLPLQAILEFNDNRLVIDRALHRLSSPLELYNIKTFKKEATFSIIEHTLVLDKRYNYKHKSIFEEPALDEFPFKNTHKAERLVEGLQGFVLEELILRGNYTLAVGFLVGVIIPILKNKNETQYLKIGTDEISKKYLPEVLGTENRHLAPFYALRTERGRIVDKNK